MVTAQPPADVEPVSARNHDVEQKQGRRFPLGIGDYIGGGMKQTHIETCRFQGMLHQPRYIGIVFQNKYGLAQTVCLPSPHGRRPVRKDPELHPTDEDLSVGTPSFTPPTKTCP